MRKSAGSLILAMLTLLGGCQALFTFSPLSGLKRDPADMSPEQRLAYAHDALASGDHDAMLAAYNAILGDTSADAQYTSAQLGIELSGVTQVLLDCANDPSIITAQLNTIDAFITAHNLDPNYMVAAAAQLAAAAAVGAVLSTMDYAMGSMGCCSDTRMRSAGPGISFQQTSRTGREMLQEELPASLRLLSQTLPPFPPATR